MIKWEFSRKSGVQEWVSLPIEVPYTKDLVEPQGLYRILKFYGDGKWQCLVSVKIGEDYTPLECVAGLLKEGICDDIKTAKEACERHFHHISYLAYIYRNSARIL